MSIWPSSKANKVFRALLRRGWTVVAEKGSSHKQLSHPDYPEPYTWAFYDGEEIGPVMLSRIAKRTGLQPRDL